MTNSIFHPYLQSIYNHNTNETKILYCHPNRIVSRSVFVDVAFQGSGEHSHPARAGGTGEGQTTSVTRDETEKNIK